MPSTIAEPPARASFQGKERLSRSLRGTYWQVTESLSDLRQRQNVRRRGICGNNANRQHRFPRSVDTATARHGYFMTMNHAPPQLVRPNELIAIKRRETIVSRRRSSPGQRRDRSTLSGQPIKCLTAAKLIVYSPLAVASSSLAQLSRQSSIPIAVASSGEAV